jgi:hypothetical protein
MYFVLFFFILLPFSGQQKIRHTGGGREYGRKNAQLIFSHSDYTAGLGISPSLRFRARGLYRPCLMRIEPIWFEMANSLPYLVKKSL